MSLEPGKQRILQTAGVAYENLRYRMNELETNEAQCRYISSHGLKKSCNYWHKDGRPPEIVELNRLAATDHSNTLSIYFKTNGLRHFADQTLGRMENRFVLVTGGCDLEVGDRDTDSELRARILGSPLLDAWFTQNCNDQHPKLLPMPIGMDYHTLTFQFRHRPWGYFANPLVQEQILDDARTTSPGLEHKKIAGYSNWHHVITRGDRHQCINGVQLDAAFLEQPDTNRAESWKNNAEYLFTISPLGNGWDCHRTWEALLLGSVPIVPRSSICSLFENLPVCIVDDWREVTMDYLKAKREWVLESEFDFAPLYLGWWKARFKEEAELPRRMQRFQDFINTAQQPFASLQKQTASAV
ncbi:hypothetical protein [Hoeflea sp. TYP-13]|uniref:hypothetical protein n=1 Tax=Hoeflea sp. TYP-13 TaxID=3230023 RepID=UPI0034C5EE07